MILAHKIALDPNNAQATYFAKACGVARLAYNWGLTEWKQQYAAGGKPSWPALDRYFNYIKRDKFPFVLDVTKCSPQAALMNLGEAFKNFFSGKAKYPTFKKKGVHDVFEISNNSFVIDGCKIHIPKIGWVRMREALRFTGKHLSATISRTASRWFVSIVVEMPDPAPERSESLAVGIDWGCTNFASLSTGEKIEGPKPHKAMLDRLRRLNKSLHRKVLGSKNRAKAKAQLARLHARIANIRNDFLHKFTTDICRRFGIIGIEDLNVSGMAKTTLARSVLDQSPYKMRRQLEYKAPMHGCILAVADRFYPSSKMCSDCGEKIDFLSLSIREWTCTKCGTIHDRDDNASKNLESFAVGSMVTASGPESADGGNTTDAKLAGMKEEPNIAKLN